MTSNTPRDADAAAKMDAWTDSARKEVANLLLSGGLYQRVELTPPAPLPKDEWANALPRRLHKDCDNCKDTERTTWAMDGIQRMSVGLHDYRCLSCGDNRITFMLAMSAGKTRKTQKPRGPNGVVTEVKLLSYSIKKVGQHPEWEVPLSATLKKALGNEGRILFVKGASSLRAGRGIGAVAYFRRIIENHIDDILRIVSESAAASGDAEAVQQLANAQRNLYATERLKIAAQYTPIHLKPGNHNPLDVMYGTLSESLHGLSDEESANRASQLLANIAYFFESWQQSKDRAEQYAQAITKAATKSS